MKLKPAPELTVSGWLNTAEPMSLAGLRGQIVLLEAFQMLCRAVSRIPCRRPGVLPNTSPRTASP